MKEFGEGSPSGPCWVGSKAISSQTNFLRGLKAEDQKQHPYGIIQKAALLERRKGGGTPETVLERQQWPSGCPPDGLGGRRDDGEDHSDPA